jgi:SAM-dependent methyltransferase
VTRTQEEMIAAQFGAQAGAYVASAVHARGEDLDELERLVAGAGVRRALDAGCGGGHVTYRLAPHVERVVAYDLSQEMLDAVHATAAGRGLANVETRRGVVQSMPFDDGAFDLAASRYSAHHWSDLRVCLREIARVLRPAGRAVLIAVASPGTATEDSGLQALELLRDPSHVRDYSTAEWIDAAGAAGLRVESAHTRPLRLEFASWVARMRTAPAHVEAIRSLQRAAPASVVRRFDLEPDGSFTVDTLVLHAVRG